MNRRAKRFGGEESGAEEARVLRAYFSSSLCEKIDAYTIFQADGLRLHTPLREYVEKSSGKQGNHLTILKILQFTKNPRKFNSVISGLSGSSWDGFCPLQKGTRTR